jgi:hypothetical protein
VYTKKFEICGCVDRELDFIAAKELYSTHIEI